MVDVNTFLLMMLYMLGIVLLVALIVLIIKLISTVNRVNGLLDDVDKKMAKIDKAFNFVDAVTDNLAMISDRVVDGITNTIRRLFNKKSIGKGENINE